MNIFRPINFSDTLIYTPLSYVFFQRRDSRLWLSLLCM
nr:MAG TPA: hypothetical protein [Caudoviricetes sp.]DAS47997.1 MAG TPA: hypothetical protein [Caudoviricetes sp.]